MSNREVRDVAHISHNIPAVPKQIPIAYAKWQLQQRTVMILIRKTIYVKIEPAGQQALL